MRIKKKKKHTARPFSLLTWFTGRNLYFTAHSSYDVTMLYHNKLKSQRVRPSLLWFAGFKI